ncbi:dockerin type I domain-containing protein [Rubripirellula amarantea]|nr:dockerin type I domain-containing protein [Rubripirellula amarantea]
MILPSPHDTHLSPPIRHQVQSMANRKPTRTIADSVARRRASLRRRDTQRRLRVERLTDRRVLAAITGAVFEDANVSFALNEGEVNAPSRLVYIDVNDNASLDPSDLIALAEVDGSFAFTGLADGTYSLRLFNGTATQYQTMPVGTDGIVSPIALDGGAELISGSAGTAIMTSDSIVSVDLNGPSLSPVRVADSLTKTQQLIDGSLLVIGTDSSVSTAWRIEPSTGNVASVDLSGATPPVFPMPEFVDLAIDGTGHGVVLESGAGLLPIRTIDASDPGNAIVVSVTDTFVPEGTSVLTSRSGPRSVFATPNGSGLDLSLWSNSTATLITPSATLVDDATEMLGYDDASGLLALRGVGGGVSVHDVDANFDTLHQIDRPLGPIVIDGARDLLFAISPDDAMLALYDLTSGELITDMVIDFASVGTPVSLALGAESNELLILGTAGLAEIALDKPTAIEVTIAGQQDVDTALFGVAMKGANTAPRYESVPSFETDEDQELVVAAPAALSVSVDDEDDSFVVVQVSQATNGVASVSLSGSLNYTPDPNFNGDDSFDVVLHDGRDVSDEVAINLSVIPVSDPPEGITVTVPPVPEDVPVGGAIGDVEVIDFDGGGHVFDVDDIRFGVEGGKLIFVGGILDFETEPFVNITVTATDTETSDTVSDFVTVTIRDANDPIVGILPKESFVNENVPGATINSLRADDQDVQNEQEHTFAVDNDSRFIVDGAELRLADGVALDYELEQSVVIMVTATEVDTGNSFSQEITIFVRDFPEQPEALSLSNQTVMELVDGAVIGDVLIDGGAANARFELTVNSESLEIVGGELKVKDDQFVTRDSGAQIVVEITATDTLAEFGSISEQFVIEVLENETPAHNRDNPYDVNHNDDVSAQDALLIINYLNIFGPGPVGSGDLGFCYDVNADGMVTALDALLVVNHINVIDSGGGVGGENGDGELGPEGELAPGSQLGPEGEFIPLPANSYKLVVTDDSEETIDRATLLMLVVDQRRSQVAAAVDSTRDQTIRESALFNASDHEADVEEGSVEDMVRLLSDLRS